MTVVILCFTSVGALCPLSLTYNRVWATDNSTFLPSGTTTMDSTIILLLELLLLAAITGAGLYFRGYLPEKGKNLATKEDITGLTRLEEATKLDYSRQIEAFRSSLQHQWGAHTDFASDRKETLFQFFETCTLLLADKFSINLRDLPSGQGEGLYKYQESVGQVLRQRSLSHCAEGLATTFG